MAQKKRPKHKFMGVKAVDSGGRQIGTVIGVYKDVRYKVVSVVEIRTASGKRFLAPASGARKVGDELRLNVTAESVRKSPKKLVRRNKIAPAGVRRTYSHYGKSLPAEYSKSIPKMAKAHNGSNLGPMAGA